MLKSNKIVKRFRISVFAYRIRVRDGDPVSQKRLVLTSRVGESET